MAVNKKMQMVLGRDNNIILSNGQQSPTMLARQPSNPFCRVAKNITLRYDTIIYIFERSKSDG